MNIKALLFVLLTYSLSPSEKMPVEFVDASDGLLGSRLAYRVKETIRESSGLEMSFDPSIPRLKIILLTLDPIKDGNYTAYSLILAMSSKRCPTSCLLDQFIGTCGLDKIQDCNEIIMAKISSKADALLKAQSLVNQR